MMRMLPRIAVIGAGGTISSLIDSVSGHDQHLFVCVLPRVASVNGLEGHEEWFQPPRLSDRCAFRERSFLLKLKPCGLWGKLLECCVTARVIKTAINE
jgi:hypothetical protein